MNMLHFFKDWRKVLAAIFLIAALLRFYNLGENSFVADEFLDINASYGYFKTGEWQAWDFNFERPDSVENANAARDERAFAYKWQVAQLFHWFAPTEATARAVSALWGLVTVAMVFWMTAYFTKKKEIGLIAAFLCAVSISALAMDRRLRMYAMFVPVFLTFSWMTFLFLEEKYRGKMPVCALFYKRFGFNLMYLVPAAILGILSLHLHLLTVNIAFIAVAYALIQAILIAWKKKQYWNKYVFIVVSFIAGIVGIRFVAPESFQLFASSFSFPDNHYDYFRIVLLDYSHTLLAIAAFGLGAWHLIRKENFTKEGLWLVVAFLTPLLMAVFMWRRNVGEQYISFAQPFKMMIIAAGIYAFVQFFKEQLIGFGKKAVVVPMTFALLVLPNYAYFFQEDNTYHQTSQSDNAQYKKVFAYFLKNKAAEDIVITRDLRSYYVSGAHTHIENIGGENTKDKLTLERLQSILTQYPSGWVILSDNDDVFVSKDAMQYIEKNMERISNSSVRGKVLVYRWRNPSL